MATFNRSHSVSVHLLFHFLTGFHLKTPFAYDYNSDNEINNIGYNTNNNNHHYRNYYNHNYNDDNYIDNGNKFSNHYIIKHTRNPFVRDSTDVFKDCSRNKELTANRKCLKRCGLDRDCRGRARKCVCDGACGWSCVKMSQKCELVKLLFNGKFEITPFNKFGAVVRYTCYAGFELSGQRERVCQGDGYWSGRPPTCKSSMMSSNVQQFMPTYEEGTCSQPPIIKHANHDASPALKTFPLGAQLTYSCSNGFKSEGGYRALCVSQGRWVGLTMNCQPKQCGHPGDVPNSRRDGSVFNYPHRVTYTCLEGYERIGRNHITCQADGRWSSVPPICRPKSCPELIPPINGLISGSDRTYGATLKFSCLRGFIINGPKERTCQSDGQWSDENPECVTVNCGDPGPIYNGYYIARSNTTFGSNITFFCYNHSNFDGASNTATCLDTGIWSHPVPKCWVKCRIPEIINGTLDKNLHPDNYLSHGQSFNFTCKQGFINNSPDATPICKNGTWSLEAACKPAPCKNRPPEIKDGLVRFHSLDHGSRAQCICNPGRKIKGDPFLVCMFGQWVGKMPICEEVYCKYPGDIEHGQIMIVGIIGKYEYHDYITKVPHNEQIEYQCGKGYGVVGSRAATCVDGEWSPPNKPKCELRKHPPLPKKNIVF